MSNQQTKDQIHINIEEIYKHLESASIILQETKKLMQGGSF